MPHIDLPQGVPGILALMQFRPETAKPLNELAEVLLRGDSTLSRGERELIAAFVSGENGCTFCRRSHGEFARLQLVDGTTVVDAVQRDHLQAPVSLKLRALLSVAAKVCRGGCEVLEQDVAAARAEGATDLEIHDTVLIAGAFCMYNRYVDGLGTWVPTDDQPYEEIGRMIVASGYLAAVPG